MAKGKGGNKQGSIKKQDSINKQNSIKRQESVKSRNGSIKKCVEKFEEERKKYAGEKDDDYAERRKRKKRQKERIKRDRRLRMYKCLYWPSFILIFCGCIFLFGATIKSISEGSALWEQRHAFRIAGPVIMCVGLILFMIAVAVVSNHTNKIKEINKQEESKRREERQKRIYEMYLKRKNSSQSKFMERRTLGRTISNTSQLSSATCHTIDELDSSAQFVTGEITSQINGCLHPNWKPLNKKNSMESEASSKLLNCSINSTSTLMTSLSSNASSCAFRKALNSNGGEYIGLAHQTIPFIDENENGGVMGKTDGNFMSLSSNVPFYTFKKGFNPKRGEYVSIVDESVDFIDENENGGFGGKSDLKLILA